MNSIFLISLPVPTRTLSRSRSRFVVPTLSRSVVRTWLCRPTTVSLYMSPVCSPNKWPETKIFAASSPTNDGGNTEEGFWLTGLDDLLLADVVTKNRKAGSANWAKLHVDAAILKLGAEAAEKDPLWADLVAESKLLPKLRLMSIEARRNYMLQRQITEEDMTKALIKLRDYGQQFTAVVAEWFIKYGYRLFEWPEINEGEFWISGLDDTLLADVGWRWPKKRKYVSALFAKLSVDAAIRKLGAEVAEKDPLWADLVAESKLLPKLELASIKARQNYMLQRQISEEDMTKALIELGDYGQLFTTVVGEWFIKYEYGLFEVD